MQLSIWAEVRLFEPQIEAPEDWPAEARLSTASIGPLWEGDHAAGSSGIYAAVNAIRLATVYAIGDCAEHRNIHSGGQWLRLESVQNANDQATIAAKAIMGSEDSYAAIPWFWSNQYDLRLQTVGLSLGNDAVIVRGDPAARSFSVVYLKLDRVIVLDCVNAVRDYSHGKALIAAGKPVDPDRLADATVPLKSLLD